MQNQNNELRIFSSTVYYIFIVVRISIEHNFCTSYCFYYDSKRCKQSKTCDLPWTCEMFQEEGSESDSLNDETSSSEGEYPVN